MERDPKKATPGETTPETQGEEMPDLYVQIRRKQQARLARQLAEIDLQIAYLNLRRLKLMEDQEFLLREPWGFLLPDGFQGF
jgi:hypothetical protein